MDNYVDIHSHILYGIDDGSKTLEQSIKILQELKEIGFKKIVLTPHYIINSKYQTNNKEKQKILEEIKKNIQQKNIDIELYLGNEVLINDNIYELIEKQEISTINNSKYILIELPLYTTQKNALDIMYELKIKNKTPILAHPERYEFIQKNPKAIEDFINEGIILQANYGSIIGIYGKKAKKTIKKLLKENYISLFGTDIHYENSKIYLNINKIRKKIKKIIGEQKSKELMTINPNKIINNEEISK